jgi:toxin HigB-1
MIKTFRHRGLQRFFSRSDRSGISAQQSDRLRRMLDRLDAATKPEDMNVPGYKFHALKGERKGSYAVWVSGNWRLTFGFKEGEAIDVNLEDYH